MKTVSSKEFLKLSKRDFENGAVAGEIWATLRHREQLVEAARRVVEEYRNHQDTISLYHTIDELAAALEDRP